MNSQSTTATSNGTLPVNRLVGASKSKATSKSNGKASKSKTAPAPHAANLKGWAHSYVLIAGVLSALLNGLANAKHAPEGSAVLAWALGIVVPGLVLILGRVASLLYLRGVRKLAYLVGAIASALLFLSVFHCTEAIALLTGSAWYLAFSLAIGIDAGMIACEVASVATRK